MFPASHRIRVLLFCLPLLTLLAAGVRLSGQASSPRPAVAAVAMPAISVNPIPADFNRDGRVDLIAGHPIRENPSTGGELVLRLGNGDGTFQAERVIATPSAAAPLAIGDFNGDGAIDILALDGRFVVDGDRPTWILPGRGDGTFGAAIMVDAHLPARMFSSSTPPTAVVDDFTGDGKPDIAIAMTPGGVRVYPGNGDFTFGAPAPLTPGESPSGIAAADVNGDGRRDLLVAARDGHEVDVFINHGGLLFGLSAIPIGRSALDVAAADLNRDGKMDLMVAAATENIDFRWTFDDGAVLVMLGNGDGTFQAPAAYSTQRGPQAIVSGDFNRDGVPDVATLNQTGGVEEDCGPRWNNVSILTGNGTGALAAAASFQLSYDPADTQFTTGMHALYAAQLDGDTQPDLVTGGGVLLNRPEAPNRAPVANAGPDVTVSDNNLVQFNAQASDPDNERLDFLWRDENGRTFESCLEPLVAVPSGKHTYSLIVHDDRFGTAADSVTITNTASATGPTFDLFRPNFSNPVPANAPYVIQWKAADPNGGQIVDIDISVDRHGQTNFTPIANCTNLSGTTSECVWNDPGPASNDAALLFHIVDSHGEQLNTVARFQIVDTPAGGLPAGWSSGDVGAVGAAGASAFDGRVFTVRGSGADVWDVADEFHWAFRSATGDFEWTARVVNLQNINRWTKAGLMVRESQAAGARHASIFATPGTEKPISFQRRPVANGASVSAAGTVNAPPVWLLLRRTGDTIAAFYRTTASGAWAPLGTQTLNGLPATVQVGLAVSSHVDGTLATAAFDGVTLSGPAALSPQPLVLRPEPGEQLQVGAPYTIRWLPASNGADTAKFDVFFIDARGVMSPITECANVPGDQRWCVWNTPLTSQMGDGRVKVVATSSAGVTGEAFSNIFQIVQAASGPGGMPPGWTCGDVGAVAAPGSCRYEVEDELSPDFVIQGSGADIWDTADEFSNASYAAYGDFSFTARVLSVQNVNRWTKAGLMIRDWNGTPPPAGSRHASFFVTPSTEKGTAFQRRESHGGVSVSTPGPVTTAPIWVKLIRRGNTIRAYYRIQPSDPWTLAGEQVFAGLPYRLSAMLVVSSHVDGTLAEARFDNVQIEEDKPMQSVDIGGAAPGTTSVNWPEITIEGNGTDIWGTADAFRFHYTKWRGNGFVIARVRSIEDANPWSKAGVMFRESLDPGSKQVMAIVSASRGLAMQSRSVSGGTSVSTGAPGHAPVWIMLRRFGDEFTSAWSLDGESWNSLGQVTIPMNQELFVGLPVTSHAPGTLATAVFDEVAIRGSR
jgi:hypothetical protein